MAYQRREYPEWSWSFSRARLFSECKRRYYYHYYQAHNGWERSCSELARRTYRLKKLTNLYLVFGEAVHQAARYAVSKMPQGQVETGRLIEHVRNKLNGAYRSSRRKERWLQAPNRHVMLHEFYYGDGPSKPLIERIKKRIPLCLEHLCRSKTLEEVAQLPSDSIIENDDAQPFAYQGTKVYAIPDLVYRAPSGEMVVVDWKTGQDGEEHRDQVALYGLYTKLRYGWPDQGCIGRVEYLEQGTSVESSLTDEDLERAEKLIRDSSSQMQGLLADEALNRPLEAENFPLTSAQEGCRWCNFFELCRETMTRGEEKSG